MRYRTLSTCLALGLTLPASAGAIPAFARRYRVSCTLCHATLPRLSAFGEQFAANGYRMAPGEVPSDTIATGDPLLYLARSLPLAMRVDAYVQAYSKGAAVTDFASPYLIKLLASGPLSKQLSYYMYVNLLERGEFGGFEDAILIANDLGGKLDLSLGQFQVSDPLFKRELRMSFEDYAMYRARIGDEVAQLTYDRGLMLGADFLGFDVTGMVLNGNGIDPVNQERQFDDNGFKTLAGRISRNLGSGLRLGAVGYRGESRSGGSENRVTYLGGDATVTVGPLELNAQYLHREDTNPTFAAAAQRVKTDGGFMEVLLRPQGSRWHGFALYNLVSASQPLLDVRLGGPANLERYETLTGGAGYLLVRNFKVTGELTWDTERERARWTLGFVTAF